MRGHRTLCAGATAFLLALSAHSDAVAAPWCGVGRVTGYNRLDPAMNDRTFDGTPITTDEPIVAASRDVSMGAIVEIEGVGTFRVADRGSGLHPQANGGPHIDVAVWSNAEARALTGDYNICVRRPE